MHGKTSKRSELTEGRLREALQGVAVEQLAGANEVWVTLDTSDLRKPHAREMEALMEVHDLVGRFVAQGQKASSYRVGACRADAGRVSGWPEGRPRTTN